jgi:hypothetical protein
MIVMSLAARGESPSIYAMNALAMMLALCKEDEDN